MAKKKYTLDTTDIGCPHPDEYDLKSHMDDYCFIYGNGKECFIRTDAGKVIGTAKAYLDIRNQVDSVLTTDWITVKDNDYRRALNDLCVFNTQVALDSRVNGGSVILDKEEVVVLNRLLSGYVVGPDGQKVLDKLRQSF